MFQSDGRHPIDISAFRPPAPPAPAPPRVKSLLSRSRRARPPAAPVPPSPPGMPKPARARKADQNQRGDRKPREEKPPPQEPPTVPEGWTLVPTPKQVSLPASVVYVVWRAAVLAVIAAFYVIRFVLMIAVRPFLHMLG